MDILFVNDIHFTKDVSHPQIGQLILEKILVDRFSVETVNFDYLYQNNILEFTEDISRNISVCGEYILSKDPKIVGFYTICDSFVFTVQIAEFIKERNSNITIIFGGPHASLTSAECLKSLPFLDVVAIGESELTIIPLVECLLDKKDLSTVKNVAFRGDKGDIIFTKKERLLKGEELHAYTVLDYSPFKLNFNDTFELEGGRGCPFACTFCSTSMFWGRQYRVKPVEHIIEEMQAVYKLYGIKKFYIVHDMFTANREYILKFCDCLEHVEQRFEWNCSARVDCLPDDVLERMYGAGCRKIYVGIETGSQRMQVRINKNLCIDEILPKINKMIELGIEVTASFIYGYPEETTSDFKETITLLEQLLLRNVIVQLHRFSPLPETIEFNRAKGMLSFGNIISDFCSFDNRIAAEKTYSMIKLNEKLYSQYYYVDNDVYRRFGRFDYFLYSIMNVYLIYTQVCSLAIEEMGLIELYDIFAGHLDELLQKHALHEDNERNQVRIDVDFFAPTLKSIVAAIADESNCIEEVIRYEDLKYFYFLELPDKAYTHEFVINIENSGMKRKINARKPGSKHYIKYFYDGVKINTKEISSIKRMLLDRGRY